ncbi:tyrosine-type recombinase/integrase [Actinocatenispora comari]|uniref:Putative prophage phiRv2 integrase n=1 Tax=Actinocatenispora comari TaxID=2807577 RepID=A0A8J4AGU9_9ACTN|nr:site-specific integrase [Actinocatenispora comari]GIL30439.1 putative prophage phiRv2 integrase [Actinocatenispora comari]
MARRRRHFGRVRQLPSGRWQARYPGPDGLLRTAPKTFETRKAAEKWLTDKEHEINHGDWIDPDSGCVPVVDYVETWIADRDIRLRTRENYGAYLRNQITPYLADVDVNELTSARVRSWLRRMREAGVGEQRRAGAYRLLRAALNTAVNEDHMIKRNPCNIKGAGTVETPEREVITLDQVFALADALPKRYRLMVLLSTFVTLRWGELVGLRRERVNLETRTLRVARNGIQGDKGPIQDGDPKTLKGFRTLTFPEFLAGEIEEHLTEFVGEEQDALLFIGPRGGRPKRNNFHRLWAKARVEVGVPEIHFHDLRHTGSTLAAEAGANLAELMQRMGHSTSRAALIYLHATQRRDREVADRIGKLAEAARPSSDSSAEDVDGGTGTPAGKLGSGPRGTEGARGEKPGASDVA